MRQSGREKVSATPTRSCDDDIIEVNFNPSVGHKPSFRESYLRPALDLGLIEMTIPDKPRSSAQKYRRTR